MWHDRGACVVQLHGIPGSSWMHEWQVTEEGRRLAARLLAALSDQQIVDMFTVARVAAFRGDTVESWVSAWHYKVRTVGVVAALRPLCVVGKGVVDVRSN